MTFTVEFAPGAGPFDVIGQHHLLLNGAGSASTPDHASLDITGDIDVRAELTLDLWTPTYNPVLVSKWNATGNQRSYMFWMSEGRLALSWSTDGTLTNALTLASSVSVPIQSGRLAVRAALDVSAPGSTHEITFYTAPSLAGPWTFLDLNADFGTTSIFSGTATLLVGNVNASESPQPLIGRVHAAQVRSSIDGTIVANPDFSAQAVGATSFNDSTGKTWTMNSPAAIVGFDWVDLSSRLVAASWNEGRDDELEQYGPGEATIVLRNDDRALDPDNAAGPYFGKLLPRTPFRIRETEASPQDRFYGFVDSGFEQEYAPPNTAMCKLKLTDRLSAVAGLLPDVFEHAVLSRAPVAFWSLESDNGAEHVADLSGNGHDGTVVGDVKFGEPAVAVGHGPSARFTATEETYGRVDISRSPLLSSPGSASVVATFRAATPGQIFTAQSLSTRVLFVQGNGVLSALSVATGVMLSVDVQGDVRYVWLVNGSGTAYEVVGNIVDGSGHLVFAQNNGVAIDTTTLNTNTTISDLAPSNGVGIGGFRGIHPIDHWDGWVGAVAVFARTLTLADRQSVLDGYTKLSGKRSDEHISWALDRVGVPAEHRNLEQGTVIMGPADTRGRDALEYIREVVATEQGEFYVDHRDGGKLRFRSRYARFTDTRSTTSQATFTDDTTDVDGVGILIGGLDVAPNGIDGIVNQASVKWRDGEETVEDTASVAKFGPQQRSVTTQATTATQARSAGEWLVARYAQPRSRVRGITTRPDASDNALTAARSLRVGDRVSYRFHPQRTGSVTLLDLFVEGIDHEISDGTVRVATYRTAPVNTFTPWIWGTSEWDNETFWG